MRARPQARDAVPQRRDRDREVLGLRQRRRVSARRVRRREQRRRRTGNSCRHDPRNEDPRVTARRRGTPPRARPVGARQCERRTRVLVGEEAPRLCGQARIGRVAAVDPHAATRPSRSRARHEGRAARLPPIELDPLRRDAELLERTGDLCGRRAGLRASRTPDAAQPRPPIRPRARRSRRSRHRLPRRSHPEQGPTARVVPPGGPAA